MDVSIFGDLNQILKVLIDEVKQNSRSDWMKEVREYKEIYPFNLPSTKDELHLINLIRFVGGILGEDSIIATDVGQHQMWTAQAYPFKKRRTFLTSGGLGTMGFGLHAAIGAALANPDKTVVCFSGDGSILANNDYVVIELLVKNHPGVMFHITGLFARRAFNLEGILWGQIGHGTVSRMYLLVKDDDFLEQIVKQFRKLYDVLKVNIRYDYAYALFHNPELMLRSDNNESVFETIV